LQATVCEVVFFGTLLKQSVAFVLSKNKTPYALAL
jgi:hypothetical protein